VQPSTCLALRVGWWVVSSADPSLLPHLVGCRSVLEKLMRHFRLLWPKHGSLLLSSSAANTNTVMHRSVSLPGIWHKRSES
jgi:hypothetical protein